MFNQIDFAACVRENLEARRFGKKRIDEIIEGFERRRDFHVDDGRSPTDASLIAMRETYDALSTEAFERHKRTSAMIRKQAENNDRIAQADNVDVSAFVMDGKRGSRGTALARAAVSLIEDDPRFSGLSYNAIKDTTRQQLYAVFGDTLESVGKGAFGRQRGKAHLPNIIREIMGQSTGDRSAAEFAKAWLQVSDLGVDLFNQAGGSMRKLNRFIPQRTNTAKLLAKGEKHFVDTHMRGLDWQRTRWPDGKLIEPNQREEFLREVYRTKSTDGANKIDPKAFRGQGGAVGNQLDNHRLLHFKNAEAWLEIHEAYGDGNVFEVFQGHVEDMAHRIALVETFGPNPELTMRNVQAIVRRRAAELTPQEQAHADAVLKNKFEPMFEVVTRENPMDANSTLGNLVTGAGNILTAAQLGSASLLAIPGDFVQTAMVRALNNMGMFDGTDFYMKSILTDQKFMRQIATQSGFVMDEVVMSTYSQARFTGVASVGPAASRRIAETVMRLSLMSGHTRAARWATQAEFLGLMQRMRDTNFAELPFRHVMQRYGIGPEEWDAFRQNVKPWSPRKDVNFLRPIDVLQSDLPNKQRLYQMFQGMVFEESRKMVPESTIEGAVALKDTTRPDTLPGAILHSFSMYKNFPVSFAMIYGRLGLTAQTARGRLAFYAGLGASMTLVGALGTQMREVSKGNEPLPMNTPAFFGKAMLSGGALSIYGDFLFAGVNEFGRGPGDVVAGPVVAFGGDTTNLLLGDIFQWADTVGSLSPEGFESTTGSRAVEYASRYAPGTSIWWARAALQRQVFDRLREIADPTIHRRYRQAVRRRERDTGVGYFWAPGQRVPDFVPEGTLPDFITE